MRGTPPKVRVSNGMPRSIFRLLAPATLAVVALSATAAGHPIPPPRDPDAIVRRADQALAALRTLRAEFVQEVVNPLLERTTTGRGRLLYKAPDRFRIAYSDPAGDLVVHDGTNVWIYLPSTQPGQVIRQSAAATGVRNPLTYLRDLRGRFTAREAGVETVSGRPADKLVLSPSAPDAGFTEIVVWVDRGTALLRRVRTTSEDGLVTTYTFTTLERNVALDDGPFRFRPPRGIEVYDQ
jgi:outer membrane lipoprotein carrier protein